MSLAYVPTETNVIQSAKAFSYFSKISAINIWENISYFFTSNPSQWELDLRISTYISTTCFYDLYNSYASNM